MKRWFLFLIAALLAFYGIGSGFSAWAQKSAQKVTVLFSNNINGEIEPCPT